MIAEGHIFSDVIWGLGVEPQTDHGVIFSEEKWFISSRRMVVMVWVIIHLHRGSPLCYDIQPLQGIKKAEA